MAKVDIAMLKPAELIWLLAAVAKNDEVAFERLYVATRSAIYGVLLRVLRDPNRAGEVMRESYVQIWQTAGQFEPGAISPMSWKCGSQLTVTDDSE